MKSRVVVFGVVLLAGILVGGTARAQDASLIAGVMNSLFQRAKTCADQMKAIGFEFDEVRTELDLTPKLEIFFRDVWKTATPVSTANMASDCRRLADALLATRRVSYAGFRLTGVKIDFPGLRAVLIHSAVH